MVATRTKPEPLPERLARQEGEHQDMIGPQQDALNVKLAANENQLTEASQADDTSAVRRIAKEREVLIEELSQLQDDIQAKQLAIAATRRQLEAAAHAVKLEKAVAHAKTAADIAPGLEQSMFDTADFIKRFAGQLTGVRVTLGGGPNSPVPSLHDLAAWIVGQLTNAGLPIAATCRDSFGNAIPLNGYGTPPTELAATAVTVAETTR